MVAIAPSLIIFLSNLKLNFKPRAMPHFKRLKLLTLNKNESATFSSNIEFSAILKQKGKDFLNLSLFTKNKQIKFKNNSKAK